MNPETRVQSEVTNLVLVLSKMVLVHADILDRVLASSAELDPRLASVLEPYYERHRETIQNFDRALDALMEALDARTKEMKAGLDG